MKHVLYFTADWCNPCKKVKPIVEEINQDSIIKFKIIDVDSAIDLAKSFSVQSVPTFILIEDGNVIDRMIGAQTKETLLEFINTELDYSNE
jgi:thioredoxin 1